MFDTTHKAFGCCPRPCDPNAKFAEALISLTRLYEEVREKVESHGGDIEDLKAAMQKEIADRIAADEALKQALLVVIDDKVSAEKNERVSADAELKASIEKIAGSEIGNILTLLKAETALRETGDAEEALTRASADDQLGARIDNEIQSRTAECSEIRAEVTALKTQVEPLPGFYDRVDAVEDKTEVLQQSVTGEIAARSREVVRLDGVDAALDARVTALESKNPVDEADLQKERDERIAADKAEKEAREAADSTAQGAITGLDNRLSDEVATRTAEDTKLWKAIRNGGDDYSSFYVWATDVTIPAGNVSEMPESIRNLIKSVYGSQADAVKVASPIAPNKTHSFTFRTVTDKEDVDMVVDWGDGTKTVLNGTTWDDTNYSETAYEKDYSVTHTYADAGKYLVKVTGSRYFSYRHSDTNNLVAVPFAPQAHIASFVRNAASMYRGADRLLVIDASYLYPLRDKGNTSYMFTGCTNLHTVLSLGAPTSPSSLMAMFAGCTNLTVVDTGLGQLTGNGSISSIYARCANLEADIGELIYTKFVSSKVAVEYAFSGCKKLYGTVPAKYLWDDATVEWTMPVWYDSDGSNAEGPFYGCSDDIRSQVPLSWGGTNSSIVVRPYDPVVATSHDMSLSHANAAIKLASVSTELKSLVAGLSLRVKELEESGSGGTPKDVVYMSAKGVVYAVTAINTDDDPTLSIDVASGTVGEDVHDSLYLYGSDGKRYVVRVVVVDGEATMSVDRISVVGEEFSFSTGIKLNCADDEAIYVMKVVKPIGVEAAIALVPFGA